MICSVISLTNSGIKLKILTSNWRKCARVQRTLIRCAVHFNKLLFFFRNASEKLFRATSSTLFTKIMLFLSRTVTCFDESVQCHLLRFYKSLPVLATRQQRAHHSIPANVFLYVCKIMSILSREKCEID